MSSSHSNIDNGTTNSLEKTDKNKDIESKSSEQKINEELAVSALPRKTLEQTRVWFFRVSKRRMITPRVLGKLRNIRLDIFLPN